MYARIPLDRYPPVSKSPSLFLQACRRGDWGCGVSIRPAVEPDFIAASGLPVESETERFQLPNNFSVPESCQTAHLGSDNNRIVVPVICRRQIRNTFALAPRFNQLSRDVAGNLQRFGDGSSLCYKARKFIRCCEEQTFGQFLDLYPNRKLHGLILAFRAPRLLEAAKARTTSP